MMSGANFQGNNFLVGVSIDGPQEFHDEYRRNRQGLPSFYKVMKGIELLKKHGVEYNAMAVVNDYNVDYPLEFYNFFKELDCRFIQFAPIVERIGRHKEGTKLSSPEEQDAAIELAPFSVDSEKVGDFLCALFDEWLKEDVGKFYIQLFDSTLANWVGVTTRGLLLGPPLRSRRGNGVQWRRICLRPFRIPGIQTREYPNKEH